VHTINIHSVRIISQHYNNNLLFTLNDICTSGNAAPPLYLVISYFYIYIEPLTVETTP